MHSRLTAAIFFTITESISVFQQDRRRGVKFGDMLSIVANRSCSVNRRLSVFLS